MRKLMPTMIFIILMLTIGFFTLTNADKIDRVSPAAPEPPQQEQVEIIKVTATAFNEYGYDPNGIDYGPGYVIISTESEIPLYSLLDVDVRGECQALGISPYLAKDEIKIWYNAPSDIPMFGTQTAYVRILEKGDKPCQLNE